MFPTICLSYSFPSLPPQRRRSGLASSLLLCSALRSSPHSHSSSLNALPPSQSPQAALPPEESDATLKTLLAWGFTVEDLNQCPASIYPLLDRDPVNATALCTTLLSLGFTQKHIKEMLLKYPRLLKLRSESVLSMAAYFTVKLKMDTSQFIKIMRKQPRTLTLNLNEKIIPVCHYLMEALELNPTDLSKMLTRFPYLLISPIETQLKPVVNYFLSEIGVPKLMLARRLKNQPTVLALSLESLKMRVAWLKTELYYDDDDIQHVCSLSVNMFQQGEVTLETKLNFICEKFEVDRQQCGVMLRKCPQLLCYSIKNIDVTADYFTGVIGRGHQELIKTPRLLWLSVEDRIRPRFERIRAVKFPYEAYKLATMFGCKDENFERLLMRQRQ